MLRRWTTALVNVDSREYLWRKWYYLIYILEDLSSGNIKAGLKGLNYEQRDHVVHKIVEVKKRTGELYEKEMWGKL